MKKRDKIKLGFYLSVAIFIICCLQNGNVFGVFALGVCILNLVVINYKYKDELERWLEQFYD